MFSPKDMLPPRKKKRYEYASIEWQSCLLFYSCICLYVLTCTSVCVRSHFAISASDENARRHRDIRIAQ